VLYRGRAPLRIDFAGGWTDVALFAEEHGGAVVNAAITRYARGSLTAGGGGERGRPAGSRTEYWVDAPTGAGLGASAAQTVLWTAMIRTAVDNTATRAEIAAAACQIARALGIMGGKQDEYAAALGGINFLTFGQDVVAERLGLPGDLPRVLGERLVLAHGGGSRFSGVAHLEVWDRYRAGDPAVRAALGELKRIAEEMRSALLSADLKTFGRLLDENRHAQDALLPSRTSHVDSLLHLFRPAGAVAAKECGAGGGAILFYCEEGRASTVSAALRRRGFTTINVEFDTYGVYVEKR
jgi:D-glycero-alpha-D-manno-heptose-7-phosphate kinase